MKKPTHRSSSPAGTKREPQNSKVATPAHSAPRGDQARSALDSFLRGATSASGSHADRLQASAQADESRQSASEPDNLRTPAWAHALTALETRHSANLQRALAAHDASHRQTLAQLQSRLAAAEHVTSTLASQLRELR
jgi:hypothetical protein